MQQEAVFSHGGEGGHAQPQDGHENGPSAAVPEGQDDGAFFLIPEGRPGFSVAYLVEYLGQRGQEIDATHEAADIDEVGAAEAGAEGERPAVIMEWPDAEKMLAQGVAETGTDEGVQQHGERKDEKKVDARIDEKSGCQGVGGAMQGQQAGKQTFQNVKKTVDGQGKNEAVQRQVNVAGHQTCPETGLLRERGERMVHRQECLGSGVER